MRAQAKGAPNPRDAAAAEAEPLRQRPRAPVRGVARPAFERQRHRLLHRGVADLARRTGPRLVQQPVDSAADETRAPTADRQTGQAKTAGDLSVGPARVQIN